MQQASLKEVQRDLYAGRITVRELVSFYLNNIEKQKRLNAVLEVFGEEALEKAGELDKKISQKKNVGKLAGLVVGLKDVICYKNHKMTAASKILEGFESQYSATAVDRLIAEDAIIIGRFNCDEFAMGSSSENSAFGAVLNGRDETRVAGGSSGGSAVAVQMEMCQVSLGSDTGGSVRQPAAFCGVIGLKPTYGRVSRHGLIAYASSFDVIGIFGKSVFDVAKTLEVIAGEDGFDSTVSWKPVPEYSAELHFDKRFKVAYYSDILQNEKINPAIRKSIRAVIEKLRSDGQIINEANFDLLDFVVPAYYVLTTAEASSNLARYDGMRYGFSFESDDLTEKYIKSRSEGFGPEVKRRILLGTFVLSAGYYDAYYTRAQKARRLIASETERVLEENDFIILPTTPTPAFRIGEKTKDPVEMFLADIFTVQANLGGFPAISIPAGTDESGMPVGIQVMTRKFDESILLAFSQYLVENIVP